MNFWLLLLHILGACIWIGGHLYLMITIVPTAVKQPNPQALLNFEASFEKLGMTALITQVITGLIMANRFLPSWSQLFDYSQDITILITLKLTWLICTILTAVSAQVFVIPRLKKALLADDFFKSQNYFKIFIGHIGMITVLSLAFLVTGVLFRTGLGVFR